MSTKWSKWSSSARVATGVYPDPRAVVTSNDISGYDVRAVYGEVFGVTVRWRNIGAGLTAGFRSIGGGEIPEMTRLLLDSRNEAMGRMIHQAQQRGANAIVAMRFDNGEIAGRGARSVRTARRSGWSR